jgi:hypothetical protein
MMWSESTIKTRSSSLESKVPSTWSILILTTLGSVDLRGSVSSSYRE